MGGDERDARMLEQATLRAEIRHAEQQADLRQIAASLTAMVRLLIDKGLALPEELEARIDAALAELAAEEKSRTTPVKLHTLGDKYTQENDEVDCEARLPSCKGACCSLEVPLSVQDLEEGVVRWDIARPYYLKKDGDGRCTHQDRGTLFCGKYTERPLPCRSYSCRSDSRIWRNFEQRVPNEKGIAAILAYKAERPLILIGLPPTLPKPR
jgi:Fe-S-cluster containining protein